MQLEQLEKIAAKGEPLPSDLTPPEIMLFYMLTALYATYQTGKISKEEGKENKQAIYNTYEKVKADYEQYIEITRRYQERLREGYNIGGVQIMKGEKQ